MEEDIMKKITVDEAKKLLEHGIFPKCQVARDLIKPVKSVRELNNYIKLSAYQQCQFYGYNQKELDEFKAPDDSITLSVDEATDMLLTNELIYARTISGEEESFSNMTSFVSFIRKCDVNGDNFLLYWRG